MEIEIMNRMTIIKGEAEKEICYGGIEAVCVKGDEYYNGLTNSYGYYEGFSEKLNCEVWITEWSEGEIVLAKILEF